jgi:hypothetical protein
MCHGVIQYDMSFEDWFMVKVLSLASRAVAEAMCRAYNDAYDFPEMSWCIESFGIVLDVEHPHTSAERAAAVAWCDGFHAGYSFLMISSCGKLA